MSLVLLNIDSILSTRTQFILIGLLGLLVSVGGFYKVTKSGVYYLWGTPVRRAKNPGQFLFIYFFLGFLFCVSVFFLVISIGAHAA